MKPNLIAVIFLFALTLLLGAAPLAHATGLSLVQKTIPAKRAIKEFDAEVQRLMKDPNTPQSTYDGLPAKYAAMIDFAKLSLDDALALSMHSIAYSKSSRDGLRERAKAFAVGPDRAGFRAALLTAQVCTIMLEGESPAKKEMEAAIRQLLDHPLAKGSLRTRDGEAVAMAMFGSAVLKDLDERLIEQFGTMAQGCTIKVAFFLPPIWQTWVQGEFGNKAADRLWGLYHAAMKGAIASAEKGSKSDRERVDDLKAGLKSLESPVGRGKLIGGPAPTITFRWCSDASLKSLADLKGKVIVLDFWATWCGPCMESMPKMRELAEHYKGKDVVILGVTSIQGAIYEVGKKTDFKDRPKAEIAAYPEWLRRHQMTWLIAVSDQNVYNADYGVYGIPFLVIIDSEGIVRVVGENPLTLTLEEKIKLIDPLLKPMGS